MLIDARTMPGDTEVQSDICIVGAGAAGITMARELAESGFRVAVLESGGLTYANDVQSLYRGENVGRDYFALEACRLRYLGGTTNHWGGTCRPLDASDFETREWVPYSGWPFSRSHLLPYYERAQPVLQLGPLRYELDEWDGTDLPALKFAANGLTTGLFQQSPPTRFGTAYRDDLESERNVTTYTNATVKTIETDEHGNAVTGLQAATLQGTSLRFTAKRYVLAQGGIEVPRLLLLSNGTVEAGLGNQHDLVGRFFMEHPILQLGALALSDPDTNLDLYEKHPIGDTTVKAFLNATPAKARELGLLNFGARPNMVSPTAISEGVASYVYLREELLDHTVPDDLFEHVANVIKDIDDVYRAAVEDQWRVASLKFWQESSPNPDSRVTLSDERDEFGQRRVRLDWRLNELDRRSFGATLTLIGQELGRSGVGRLRLMHDEDVLWAEQIAGSCHHMGTTRMHDDPKQGVVDRNLKVHGVSNLYVAGSSVFPTSGHANPTLTIVALSIRLADHLKGLMT